MTDINKLIEKWESSYDLFPSEIEQTIASLKALRDMQEGDGWVTEAEYTMKGDCPYAMDNIMDRITARHKHKNVRVLIQYEDVELGLDPLDETEDAPEVEKFDVLQHLRDGGKVTYEGSREGFFAYYQGASKSIITETGDYLSDAALLREDWQPYIEEPPKTKPSINGKWSDFLPDWAVCIAANENGTVKAGSVIPTIDEDDDEWCWLYDGKHSLIRIDQFPWFNRGDCPWDESLVMRPEGENE